MPSIDQTLFRAYDIRGIVNQSLTEEAVYLIARAIAVQILDANKNCVAVGRDGRLSGPAFAKQLKQGFLDSGVNVIDVGCVPTPMVYFAGQTYAHGSCVMITGSHNPSNYNGLKMVVDGETLSAERIQSLKNTIEQSAFKNGLGTERCQPVFEDYAKAVERNIDLKRPLKVVVDAGNGVAGGVAPALLQRLGCEVIQLYCDVDGNFPNHHPDPSKPENLVDLIAAVKTHQADIGLAFDGDGDRLGVVDNQGKMIFPDRQLIVFAQDILSRLPNSEFIYDVKCSVHVPREIERLGGVATMCRTGHSFIKAALKKSNAALAGEMSGHIFFNDQWFGFDDALYAAARLVQILSHQSMDSATLFNQIPESISTPELNIECPEGVNHQIISQLVKQADFAEGTVSTLDGLRVDFTDGWGLIRASNTMPVLVLRFEGDTEQSLHNIVQKFTQLIHQVCPDMVLPDAMHPQYIKAS